MRRWIDLVAARDIEGLKAFVDEFYEPDAWIDFGSRTPDALPGHGVSVILDWARDAFAQWGSEESGWRYELGEVIGTAGGVVASGRSLGRFEGHEFEVRFTYLYRVRNGRIYWMTMYATPEEALAAATSVTPE